MYLNGEKSFISQSNSPHVTNLLCWSLVVGVFFWLFVSKALLEQILHLPISLMKSFMILQTITRLGSQQILAKKLIQPPLFCIWGSLWHTHTHTSHSKASAMYECHECIFVYTPPPPLPSFFFQAQLCELPFKPKGGRGGSNPNHFRSVTNQWVLSMVKHEANLTMRVKDMQVARW